MDGGRVRSTIQVLTQHERDHDSKLCAIRSLGTLGRSRDCRLWQPGQGDSNLETSKGKILQVLKGHTHYAQSVAFGQLGGRKIVVSGSLGTIRIWDASTSERLDCLWRDSSFVQSVGFRAASRR
jgi:WD40 repeat protein